MRLEEAQRGRYVRITRGYFEDCLGLTLTNVRPFRSPERRERASYALTVRILNYPNTETSLAIDQVELLDLPPARICVERAVPTGDEY
jgi:hypothetical protein